MVIADKPWKGHRLFRHDLMRHDVEHRLRKEILRTSTGFVSLIATLARDDKLPLT